MLAESIPDLKLSPHATVRDICAALLDTDAFVREALEQIEYADRLGIDYAWEVEHHFLEEYSHSSAPEVFLAAASQRTQRCQRMSPSSRTIFFISDRHSSELSTTVNR